MKKIEFKSISIKNFLSVGATPLDLSFTSGINLITGVNLDKDDSKNGCGKSTIISAIYFALTGESLKDLKKDEMVNWTNKKSCEVILKFSIEENQTIYNYKIVRTISPTSCYLYKETEDITLSSMPKTTEFILKLLNINPEILKHIILTSTNSTLPFMQLKKVEKRKFIEGILQLEILSDVASVINKEYNIAVKEKDIKNAKKDELSKSLNIQTDQMAKYDRLKQEKIKSYQNQIDENLKKIEKLKTSIQEFDIQLIKESTKLIEQNETKLKEIQNKISKHDTSIKICQNDIKSLIERIKEYDNTICPSCNREFDNTTIQTIKNKQDELESKLSILSDNQVKMIKEHVLYSEDYNSLSKEIQIEKTKLNGYTSIRDNNSILESQISYYLSNNKQINDNIRDTNNETIDFDKVINDTKTSLSTLDTTIDQLKTQIQISDIAKFVMSEEGIKSLLVKKALEVLNNKINFYLTEFNTDYKCKFNEYFEDEFTNKSNHICNYNNLSGGEAKRIDFAILFAFNDLRRIIAGNIINIVTFDELFDSAIDNKGITDILNILIKRVEKYKECIYIITHKKELAKSINDINIIEIEKRNNFSYIAKKEILNGPPI